MCICSRQRRNKMTGNKWTGLELFIRLMYRLHDTRQKAHLTSSTHSLTRTVWVTPHMLSLLSHSPTRVSSKVVFFPRDPSSPSQLTSSSLLLLSLAFDVISLLGVRFNQQLCLTDLTSNTRRRFFHVSIWFGSRDRESLSLIRYERSIYRERYIDDAYVKPVLTESMAGKWTWLRFFNRGDHNEEEGVVAAAEAEVIIKM